MASFVYTLPLSSSVSKTRLAARKVGIIIDTPLYYLLDFEQEETDIM